MTTQHHTTPHHTLSMWLILATVMYCISPARAQNFTWLTGTTGASASNSVALDFYDHTFIAGGFDPNIGGALLSFQPGMYPTLPPANESFSAFIARYQTSTGTPQSAAYIGTDPGCAMPQAERYVCAQRIEVNRDSDIFVMGVFKGCDLILYDSTATATLTTSSSVTSDVSQKVFIARYDKHLTPVSCYIISSLAEKDVFQADIAPRAGHSLYFAVSLVEQALVEAFGISQAPVAPYDTLSMNDTNDYDIYLGRITISASDDQLVGAVCVGNEGDDFAAELSSGQPGGFTPTDDLFMSGAFEDTLITANSTGTTVSVSAGDYDVFALRFNDYDLSDQDIVTAGGEFRDQAMSLSENGKWVGGFFTPSASFPGFLTFSGYGPASCAANYHGAVPDSFEVAFIGIPNYNNGTWTWVDDIPKAEKVHSRINSVANGGCGEFYVSYLTGGHTSPTSITILGSNVTQTIPQMPFWSPCLYNNTLDGGAHAHHSQLIKWKDLGSYATQEWVHDFNVHPGSFPEGTYANITARYVADIEVASSVYTFQNGFPDSNSTDVVYTGRFGATRLHQNISGCFTYTTLLDTVFMDIPSSVTGSPLVFDADGGGSYTHGKSSGFLGGLKEIPTVKRDTLEECMMSDSVLLEVNFAPASATYNSVTNIVFTGPGVNSASGYFNPLVAGVGSHVIMVNFDYVNCTGLTDTAMIINVREYEFVIHPEVTTNGWAEGMGVEAWPATTDKPYNIYYNAGRFLDTITFYRIDSSSITLTSNTGTPSGYVVAYDACGVLWATNFQCDASGGGGYVEGLVMDTVGRRLYAVGTIDDEVVFVNSNSLSGPTTTTNGHNISSNGVEKGFVAQLNPYNGQVTWIYYGSAKAAHTNRFHGLDQNRGFVVATGEYAEIFTSNTAGYSLPSQNTTDYDMVVVVLDTLGADINATSIGALADDHGDAVDLWMDMSPVVPELHMYAIGDIQANGGSSVGSSHSFYNTVGASLTSGTEVIIVHASINTATGNITGQEWRLLTGNDDDHGMDIEILEGVGSPNYFAFCGQFTEEIDTSNAGVPNMMSTLGGATRTDGFIGTASNNLAVIGWFNREGSAVGDNESVDALEFDSASGSAYAVGKFEGTPTATLLGSAAGGFGTLSNITYLFSLQFAPNGSLVDASLASPIAQGNNEHTDIALVDTSLITTGVMNLAPFDYISFHSLNQSGVVSTVFGNPEVFIARFNTVDNAFYKKGNEDQSSIGSFTEVIVFPNPSNESFTIEMEEEFAGRLIVYNSMGQRILESQEKGTRIEAKIPFAQPGVYFLVLDGNIGRQALQLIIQ